MEPIGEPLPGLYELQLVVHEDSRGSFCEAFSRRTMAALGVDTEFVQDNESRSTASGTVRGLHLQVAPHEQGKLIRVLRGAVLDVALDMRPDSPTFLEHTTIELREDDQRALWVPPGFAHGFCTLEPNTTIAYRVTGYYNREAERAIRWDDPELAIPWPVRPEEAVLSEKDASAPSFAEFQRRD